MLRSLKSVIETAFAVVAFVMLGGLALVALGALRPTATTGAPPTRETFISPLATRSTLASPLPTPTRSGPFEVSKAALEYTRLHFPSDKTPVEIVLTRVVTVKELPELGLTRVQFTNEPPPLALVVVKGSFDTSFLEKPQTKTSSVRASYIAYVFDLNKQAPVLIETSRWGGNFRRLLNNPTLPDDNAP